MHYEKSIIKVPCTGNGSMQLMSSITDLLNPDPNLNANPYIDLHKILNRSENDIVLHFHQMTILKEFIL